MFDVTRRRFLVCAFLAFTLASPAAFASDGESDSGGDSENSGSGSSDDSGGDDGHDDGHDGGDDKGGEGSGGAGGGSVNTPKNDFDDDDDSRGRNGHRRDHEKAKAAVEQRKAVSLKELKSYLDRVYPGKILRVSIQNKSEKYYFRIRILGSENRIVSLVLDALTLKPKAP